MYIDEFRTAKQNLQKKIQKQFSRSSQDKENFPEISTDLALFATKELRAQKSNIQFLGFTGQISCYRALIYAYMCGANSSYVDELEFGTGCNRFGVDNPIPTITKRLSLYGNTEDVESIFKQVSVKLVQNLGH